MYKKSATVIALALLSAGAATVVEAGWEEGVAAFKAGNFTQAAREFQVFVEERPDVYQGHYMLGQVLLKLNRSQEALTHLRKAYELDSSAPGVQLALGRAYLDVGRYADAAGLLGKINASTLPKAQQAVVYQMLAMALEKSGDSDRALGQLAKAARISPNDAAVQYQYGAAALKAGDTGTAVAALGRAVQIDPRDAAKQQTYAQALLRQGRTSRGAAKTQAYTKAASAAQNVVAANASFDNLMLLAGAQLGAKQYDQALTTLKRAEGMKSTDWLPQFYMGQAYTQKAQYRSALSSLKQALDKARSDKDKVTVWKQLGFVYEKQKSYEDAIGAYRQAKDTASVARVEKNRETERYNREVEDENRQIEELRAEQEKIKEELRELPGGAKPPGK
jgi:tetratricopeptide (TPR) repeat protein